MNSPVVISFVDCVAETLIVDFLPLIKGAFSSTIFHQHAIEWVTASYPEYKNHEFKYSHDYGYDKEYKLKEKSLDKYEQFRNHIDYYIERLDQMGKIVQSPLNPNAYTVMFKLFTAKQDAWVTFGYLRVYDETRLFISDLDVKL